MSLASSYRVPDLCLFLEQLLQKLSSFRRYLPGNPIDRYRLCYWLRDISVGWQDRRYLQPKSNTYFIEHMQGKFLTARLNVGNRGPKNAYRVGKLFLRHLRFSALLSYRATY